MIRKSLAPASLALAFALLVPTARADRIVSFAKVESVGGYTAYNDVVTLWAQIDGRGAVRGGFIRVDRKFHGRTPIVMTGGLGARETQALLVTIQRARLWMGPRQVRNVVLNVDAPSYRVTWMGGFTQLVRSDEAAAGLRPVSRAMQSFLSLVWDADLQCAESDRFVYAARGGRVGYRRTLRIRQDGVVHDSVTYAAPLPGSKPYEYDGFLGFDQIATLETLVKAARWWTLSDFPGIPSQTDGIDEQGTHCEWGRRKTVFGGYPWNRPVEFQAVLDHVTAAGGGG